MNKITILLATYERYEKTLPLCLMSILNQSRKPDRVVLIDDSKVKKFFENEVLRNIIELFELKGIKFDYYLGESKGAVPAFQIGLNNIKDGWVYKTDDDNVLENNVLEILEEHINDSVGAMSGVIIDKTIDNFSYDSPHRIPKIENDYYNKLENLYSEYHIQMIHNQSDEIKKVEHLYSNYFFKRELAENYPIELSPSSHREETIFTYEIFRKGYNILVIPKAKIYHLAYEDNSGARSWGGYHRKKNEIFFVEKLKEWNIVPHKLKIYEDDKMFYTIKNNIKYLVYYK
jgi:glycosyltransferase involved in cell wall biosynthesis